MSTLIKLRRGSLSEWYYQNVILASGEPGFEIDTGRFKIGDGITRWNTLYYNNIVPTGFVSGSGINISLGSNGSSATISVVNGVYTSRNIIAGSGLTGGGTLANDVTINIGQGDGVSVSGDSISVDSTVVRTAGTQTIDGEKSFTSPIYAYSGIYIQGMSQAAGLNWIPVFSSAQSPDDNLQPLEYTDPSGFKLGIGLNNVTNDAQIKKSISSIDGYVPTWSGVGGDALGSGYSIETTLSGSSSSLPRADAVKNYVDSLLSANDAMVFKGTLGSGGTITSLPTTYSAGWSYRIITAGTYASKVCEIGDLIIAIVDRSGAGNLDSDWTVVQTNLDGAVIGPASSTSNNFVLFDGTSGKLIKDATFAATTIGQNLITLTNPSAITFLRLNANNTATARSASEFKSDLSLDNVENTALSTWAGSTNLTTLGVVATGTWSATTIAVNKGGTGQTTYTDGQLLIGNSTGNTLNKATLTEGTGIDITNGGGSITITHEDTSTLNGLQGGSGISSITIDGMGHITAISTGVYLTSATVCAAITDCTIDGGSFS